VDRKKRRKAQRRLIMLGGRAGRESLTFMLWRNDHMNDREMEGTSAGAKLRRTTPRSSEHDDDALTPRSRECMEEP